MIVTLKIRVEASSQDGFRCGTRPQSEMIRCSSQTPDGLPNSRAHLLPAFLYRPDNSYHHNHSLSNPAELVHPLRSDMKTDASHIDISPTLPQAFTIMHSQQDEHNCQSIIASQEDDINSALQQPQNEKYRPKRK